MYLQFTDDMPGFLSMSPTNKNSRSIVVKFTDELRNELKQMKIFPIFEIVIFRVMVDFVLKINQKFDKF